MLIKYIRTLKKYVPQVGINPDGNPYAYLKEVGGDPIGIIVSTARNQVGWSLCNKKDQFNKQIGKLIAINRADYYGTNKTNLLEEVPDSIRLDVIDMYTRSEKYFK